jgi:hypothetical protein
LTPYNLDQFGSDEVREPGPYGLFHMAQARTKQGQGGVNVNGMDTVGTTHSGPGPNFELDLARHVASPGLPKPPNSLPGPVKIFFLKVDMGVWIDI